MPIADRELADVLNTLRRLEQLPARHNRLRLSEFRTMAPC
jgi:hypothetical protein